jgi:rubrerythrin
MSIQQSERASKRHQLLRRGKPTVQPAERIKGQGELIRYLRTAIEVELSTIPPYLCALYSIKDGYNVEAAKVIRSVVLEEMLHMILAANVLNAIGGEPILNKPEFIPDYPKVPLFPFLVNLDRFSLPAIETFLKIERPESPKGKRSKGITIAQYYEKIELALLEFSGINVDVDEIEEGTYNLSGTTNIFTGNPSRQITPEYYYGGGGEVIPVTDLDSALHALYEIIGQGEGIHYTIWDGDEQLGEVEEPAHYFRFNEIYKERRYTANDTLNSGPSGEKLIVHWNQVYPMQTNPKMAHYPKDSELWRKTYEFNRTYTDLLNELNTALNGEPQRLMQSVVRMNDLKYQAVELMKIPIGSGETTAGPSFEYVNLSD